MTHVGGNRFSSGKLKLLLCFLLISVGAACQILGTGETNGDKTFKLRNVSVFDENKEPFIRGQMCMCQDKPFTEVKNYPAFVSQSPRFGKVRFGAKFNQTNSGVQYYFALDESRGTGKGYDLLYFDGNQDLDLRNDPVAKLQPNPPDQGYAPRFGGIKSKAAFDFLKVNLNTNNGSSNFVDLMPRLLVTGYAKETYCYMFFVRTRLYAGDIQIASKKFHAQLGNDYAIYPGFDSPGTALVLTKGDQFDWWGGDRLSAMHKVDSRFFSFSATQTGELTVHPYQGDLGTFAIGPGGRNMTNFGVSGSMRTKDWAVAGGGDIKEGLWGLRATAGVKFFL
jgi:hypothetical protein